MDLHLYFFRRAEHIGNNFQKRDPELNQDKHQKYFTSTEMAEGLQEELPEEDLDKVGGGSWSPDMDMVARMIKI